MKCETFKTEGFRNVFWTLQKTKEKQQHKKSEEEQKKAELVVKEVLKAIQKAKAEVPLADSTVTVR
jgi:hypothetical protein